MTTIIHLAPAIAFALFVLAVEGHRLRLHLESEMADLDRLFGHADRVFRNPVASRDAQSRRVNLI